MPLWLALCGLGLAVGTPTFPGVEQGAIILLGVLPIALMQLLRPFCIFSLMALALKPSSLTTTQRQTLSLFRRWQVRWWAVVVPVPLIWLLLQLYPQAIVMSDLTPFVAWGRLGGVAVAGGSFFMANLFLQVPISVLAVLATGDRTFASANPYPFDRVSQDFTQVGLPLKQLLPMVLPPAAVVEMPEAGQANRATKVHPADRDLSGVEAVGQSWLTAEIQASEPQKDSYASPFAATVEPNVSVPGDGPLLSGHSENSGHPETPDLDMHPTPLEVSVVGISGQRLILSQSHDRQNE